MSFTQTRTKGYSIKKYPGGGNFGILSPPQTKMGIFLTPSDKKQFLLTPSVICFSCDSFVQIYSARTVFPANFAPHILQGCHHSSNTPRIDKLLESSSNPPRIQTASSRSVFLGVKLLEYSSNEHSSSNKIGF